MLEVAIKAAHRRTQQTYRAERLQRELAEDGIRVGRLISIMGRITIDKAR